jgi:hypothetical protein
MEMKIEPKRAKKEPTLVCILCDFKCCKPSSMNRHLSTDKHKHHANGNDGNVLLNKKSTEKYDCICGKKYNTYCGLWKHSKTCVSNKVVISSDIVSINTTHDTPSENMIVPKYEHDISQLTNLVIDVVKNNSDFQKQMLEMCKNMQSTIISNTNCNNNNNVSTTNNFNLQVFLNEYCKDAMNISEFIESFDLQISDLENVGRLGYIEGMSNIIISKINNLEVNKRPIHCSDLKREIIYIKDDDVWNREDANNTKFRKVISKVTRKNIGMLSDWRNKYPDCMDIESDYNEIYLKLIKEAMGPDDSADNENRIMKKVVKHLVIDKKVLTASLL